MSRPIVVDFNGIFSDSIKNELSQHLRTTETLLASAYCEAIFTPLSLMPNVVVENVNNDEHSQLLLNLRVVEVVKKLAAEGHDIIVKTANRSLMQKQLEDMLKAQGINVLFVGYASNGAAKADMIHGEYPIVIEDTPLEALRAARAGSEVILVETFYNRFFTKIYSHLNKKIHVVKDIADAPAIIEKMGTRAPLGATISKLSRAVA
ncbi:MAG: hypothetical protein M1504_01115 [Candidatus Marsarchaeota archaeon]|nr:hypothetical protein [Candidatus Marsarchaeota archaeon]